MTKFKENRKIILLLLGILFVCSPIITTSLNYNNSVFSDKLSLDSDNLKVSKISGKIHINNNWTAAKSAGTCTGNGMYSDPYIIKDLVIDGAGSGTCILIEDSDVFFTIQNCTVFNSGNTGSGIYLKNVSNGKIVNNNCSFNKNGILTYFSKNNAIIRNVVNNNSRYGIFLNSRCNNTKIDGNTACFNTEKGIFIGGGVYIYHHSYNNLIINNNASYNGDEGMRFVFTNDSKIINNTAVNNGVSFNIQLCQNITISKNILKESSFGIEAWNLKLLNIFKNNISNLSTGIDIQNSNRVNITNNHISDNNVGINLGGFYGDPQRPENGIISKNLISDCSGAGISIGNMFNLTITENNMQNCGILMRGFSSVYHSSSHTIDITNLVNGKPVYYYVNQTSLEINDLSNVGQILLVNCNQSLLSNLNIYSSSAGIFLLYCNNNEISGCILNRNTFGLFLANSHNNSISGIEINSNTFGMRLEGSNFNIIINNQANSNYAGIMLDESSNNEIYRNNIHYNLIAGIYLFFSDFNLIKQNKMNFNDIGISLFVNSNNNSVIENTLIGNGQCFLVSYDCDGNIFENNSCEDYNEIIPGYNLLLLLGILFIVSILKGKKVKKYI